MAQPYIFLPDTYRIRLQKHSVADPTDLWFNEYDVQYPVGVQPAASDALFADLLSYEQTLHYGTVAFDGAVVSLYHVGVPPGGPVFNQFFPYAAGTVGNQPGALNSLAGQGGGSVGGEVCLGVKRLVTNRRRGGRNFYRGCLQKNDLTAEAGGEWSITANPQFPTQFTALSLPHVTPYLVGGGNVHHMMLVSSHRDPVAPHYILTLTETQVNTLQLVYPAVYLNKISRKSSR